MLIWNIQSPYLLSTGMRLFLHIIHCTPAAEREEGKQVPPCLIKWRYSLSMNSSEMSLSLSLGFSISSHQTHRELVRLNDSRLSRLFKHTVMTPTSPSHCRMGHYRLWGVQRCTAHRGTHRWQTNELQWSHYSILIITLKRNNVGIRRCDMRLCRLLRSHLAVTHALHYSNVAQV